MKRRGSLSRLPGGSSDVVGSLSSCDACGLKFRFPSQVLPLLSDKSVLSTLSSLFFANAGISCLEATFGAHAKKEFGMTVKSTGALFMCVAVPSVIGSKVAGGLGNRYGRWKVVMIGMMLEGAFFALCPKSVLWVQIVSLLGVGFGMGLVDGAAPALLAQVSELNHQGTAIVYILNTVSVQVGFILGPICGSAIEQYGSFEVMSVAIGAAMVVAGPVMLVNRSLPDVSAKPARLGDAESSAKETREIQGEEAGVELLNEKGEPRTEEG